MNSGLKRNVLAQILHSENKMKNGKELKGREMCTGLRINMKDTEGQTEWESRGTEWQKLARSRPGTERNEG